MKKAIRPSLVAAALSAASLLLAASCGQKKTTLYVYNWDAYLSPEVKAAFEKQYNCHVQEDIFDSNEMLEAKIKGGGSNYDVLVPSSYVIDRMAKQGMLMPLDHSKLPNLKNIDPDILAKMPDKEMKYSVPYLMCFTSLGYLKSKVPDFKPTWRMFENPEYTKRFSLLNDLREVLGAALKTLGYSNNSTNPVEIRAAAELAMKWKNNAAKFDNEQYKNGLASGEFYFVQGYSGDIIQVQEDNDDIAIAIPEEGTQYSVDTMVVCSQSAHPDLAHAFINFMHDPQNAKLNTEFVYYLCPNTPSYDLLSEEVRGNPAVFPDKEILKRSELLLDLGETTKLYNEYWEKIKAKETLD